MSLCSAESNGIVAYYSYQRQLKACQLRRQNCILLPVGGPAWLVRFFQEMWQRGHGGLSVLGMSICLKWL